MTPAEHLLREIIRLLEQQRDTTAYNHGEVMAQLDDLNTALGSIGTEVTKVGTDVQTLLTELQTANQNPAVDLSGPIATAQGILSKLQGIDALVPEQATTSPAAPPATA